MTNFVFIMVDDMGFGDVGYHGGNIPTPIIDSLAIAGIRLESFYAQPVCTPSRAALMTGKFPYKYGFQSIVWPWNDYGLPDYLATLPQTLIGYESHMVGKWNLGHSRESMWPHNRGFKTFFGNYCGSIDYYDHNYHDVHDLHEDGKAIYPLGHLTDLYSQRACKVIQEHDVNKPLFLYVAFNAPHLPLKPRPDYLSQFDSVKDPTRRGYSALVKHLDDAIGTIVASLVSKGMINDTIIWFTSDNGGWLGCGGDNGTLQGGKITFWEGGIRVPSLIHYPPWNNGKSVHTPLHIVDVMPTLLSVAGLPMEPNMDGVDATPVLTMTGNIPDRDIILFVGKNESGYFGAMRSGDWKLVLDKEPKIYNIVADPGEKYPLSSQHLLNALIPRFLAHASSLLPDPGGIFWSPNGPPPGFNFPKVWGEPAEFVKMLSAGPTPSTWKEGLGYPADWEPNL